VAPGQVQEVTRLPVFVVDIVRPGPGRSPEDHRQRVVREGIHHRLASVAAEVGAQEVGVVEDRRIVRLRRQRDGKNQRRNGDEERCAPHVGRVVGGMCHAIDGILP
jgi:hypothetical protein